MVTEIITERHRLEQFRQQYTALGETPIDMAYLNRSLVRGFFSESGELLGGYVYCTSAPFRYVSAVPFTASELLGRDRVDATCECTCIWMDRSLSPVARIRVYAQAYRDFVSTGKRYVLGGSFHEKVMLLQRQGLPEQVFEGQVMVNGELRRAWLYVGTRWTCGRAVFTHSPKRLWRGLVRWARSVMASDRKTNSSLLS